MLSCDTIITSGGKKRRGDRLWRAAGLCGVRSNVPHDSVALYGAGDDVMTEEKALRLKIFGIFD